MGEIRSNYSVMNVFDDTKIHRRARRTLNIWRDLSNELILQKHAVQNKP